MKPILFLPLLALGFASTCLADFDAWVARGSSGGHKYYDAVTVTAVSFEKQKCGKSEQSFCNLLLTIKDSTTKIALNFDQKTDVSDDIDEAGNFEKKLEDLLKKGNKKLIIKPKIPHALGQDARFYSHADTWEIRTPGRDESAASPPNRQVAEVISTLTPTDTLADPAGL